MISVIKAVEDILTSDELALEAIRLGLLNLSAFADKIKPTVEKMTFKEVRKGTIVVALSRLSASKSLEAQELKPKIAIENLNVKSSLAAITYDNTADIQRKVSVLHPFQITTAELFSIVEGQNEVTLIVIQSAKEKILKLFGVEAKSEIDNLAAISIEFSKEHAQLPNFYFALLSPLAMKRIRIIEIVSTHTGVSFIVDKADMEEVIKVLNVFA